jgi:hypothetical protein
MIKLYQIHYDAASYKNCTHHPNIELVDNLNSFTVFFENAVILDKIPTYQGSDMVGVVSHQFDKKVRAAGNRRFDIKSFVESTPPDDIDVIGFHHRLTKQQIFHNQTRLRYNELFNYADGSDGELILGLNRTRDLSSCRIISWLVLMYTSSMQLF